MRRVKRSCRDLSGSGAPKRHATQVEFAHARIHYCNLAHEVRLSPRASAPPPILVRSDSRKSMVRAETRLEPAPKISPATALRTIARAGRFLRPYRRQIVFAAIGLVVAAAAVLAMGQGLRFVVDRG